MVEMILGGALLFWVGRWTGFRSGFNAGVNAFIDSLREHGWKMEEDEDGELTGKPIPMYGEYWYKERI